MRLRYLLALAVLVCAGGCDKKSRTRNSGGSASLVEGDIASSVPVYQFVTVEQSLGDARRALAAEKWGEASAAADALLKEMPNHAEARKISDEAKLEGPNLTAYQAFTKAAGTNDAIAMAKAWRNIGEASLYKERARPALEKVKATFVSGQEIDAKAMVRVGRCDDARRIVRITIEYFPDVKPQLEGIPVGCRPTARDDKGDKGEAAAAAAEKRPEGEAAALAPAKAPEPTPVAAAAKPEAQKLVASVDVPRASGTAPVAVVPPRPSTPSRKVPPTELEALRIAGDRNPSLPGNTKIIARRDGVQKIVMAVEVCVGTDGRVASTRLMKGSEYDQANEAVLSSIQKWRFRPYEVGGAPTPACAGVVLNYSVTD